MPSTRTLSLKAPLGGVLKRTSLENQISGTLYDSMDFWPYDSKTSRERLSIRPGFASYGSETNAKLIATLNVAPSETSQRLLITADGTAVYYWTGGTKTAATMTASIQSTSRNFQSAPYLGKLYIADDTNPVVYDNSTHAVTLWSSAAGLVGTVPTSCRLICQWANRMVLTGAPASPHLWYMSRVGNPNDWTFAADDNGSPVAATDIEGGQISEPVTSLIPHNRLCIIFGTANSITVLRNNPVAGGSLERISHVVGPVNATAWCKTAEDWTYFLTRDGMYRMPPGCGVTPSSVSREKIPESLLGLDGIADKVYMEYDVRFRMIHIYVIGTHTQAFHYFPPSSTEDVDRKGAFAPVTAPDSTILAIGRYDPIEDTDKSGVLIGTSAGLKRLDRTAALGGSSYAYFKYLFKLSPTIGDKWMIQRAMLKFGDNTNDSTATVDWYAAANGESVVALPTSRKSPGTIAAYYDPTTHQTYAVNPRVGGPAGLLHVTQADTSKHISYEGGDLDLISRGKERG
jgi:hypothetical protein